MTLSKQIMFSEEDACTVHFPHNDILIVIVHIDNYWVSKILVNRERSTNILYGGALDRTKDTLKIARAMINPQTQCNLYEFDGNETRSLVMILIPISADLYNVIMESFMIDIASQTTQSSVDLGSI